MAENELADVSRHSVHKLKDNYILDYYPRDVIDINGEANSITIAVTFENNITLLFYDLHDPRGWKLNAYLEGILSSSNYVLKPLLKIFGYRDIAKDYESRVFE